jgi:hypothetical protein
MTGAQMMGYSLTRSTAVSALVSNRIYHGMRPVSTVVPCINYFEMAGGQRKNGFETVTYSINCRAVTAETALQIARAVTDLFHGSYSTGTYGVMNGFEISRASLRQSQGLIPETSDNLYNAPVDIQIVYPSSSVK